MHSAALCVAALAAGAARAAAAAEGVRLPPSPCGAACDCPWTAPCMSAAGACVGRVDLNWTKCPTGATECHPSCECSDPTYFHLDLYLMAAPIVVLYLTSVALIPSDAPKVTVPVPKVGTVTLNVYSALGLAFMVISSAVAFLFSTLWDNIIASHGVWTYNAQCMVGVYKSIPYEEYAWFLLHTCLGLAILQVLFALRLRCGIAVPPPLSLKGRCKDPYTIVPAAVLLVFMVLGLDLLVKSRTDNNLLYLGILLSFMCPVVAFEWFMMGHFFMWEPVLWAGTIVIESVYTITVDQFAISRGVWHIYPGTGIRLPINLFGNIGIQIEQVIVYSITTVMIVSMLTPFLIMFQYWYQTGKKQSLPVYIISMLWSDAEPGHHNGTTKQAPDEMEEQPQELA